MTFSGHIQHYIVWAIAAGGYGSYMLQGPCPPHQQVTLFDHRNIGGCFSVSLPTQNGRVYALESKDSLADNAWLPLPLASGNGGNRILTDSQATNSQRFYRVRKW